MLTWSFLEYKQLSTPHFRVISLFISTHEVKSLAKDTVKEKPVTKGVFFLLDLRILKSYVAPPSKVG